MTNIELFFLAVLMIEIIDIYLFKKRSESFIISDKL